MKKKMNALSELIEISFKPLMSLLFIIGGYYLNQFTATMKAVEAHLIMTDQRILAIEVSREAKLKEYDKFTSAVEDMKIQVAKLSVSIEELKAKKH